MEDQETLAKLGKPKILLRDQDSQLVVIGLRSIMREPSTDPEIIELVEALLNDNRFARIGFPGFWSSIRLFAGFALTAIRRLQGSTEMVVVKNTPMVFTLEDREMWDAARSFMVFSLDEEERETNDMKAFQKAYEAGLLPVRDFAIPLHGTMDYKEIWRAVNLDRKRE